MRIVFMGTPQFAVPTLEKLYESKHEIVAVITKPDQKRGRGQNITYPPVKELAISKGIKVIQPQKIKGNAEIIDTLKKLKPDFFVVVAYGKILPKEVLDIPSLGAINIHGSLLPKYRGSAPIHWALVNGEKCTGVTTMLMDEGMDTGDMLLKKEILIEKADNVDTLHKKLSVLGADLLLDTLEGLIDGTILPIKQNNSESSYAPMVTKEMGILNWNNTSKELDNKIKGFNPWPGTYTIFRGERLKVLESEIVCGLVEYTDAVGTLVELNKSGLIVKTGDGTLLVKRVQPPNKGKMDATSYINGYKISAGEKFE